MAVLPTAKLSQSVLADQNPGSGGHRSFTTAAIELGVTTFALTYSVRNLEARRGGLLYRNNRTASPTDTGTTLAERLALGFQEIRCALAEVESAS